MSMVRLLTYANVIDIEGLVATTSEFQETQVHPEMIDRVVNAYREAWPNLSKHEAGYPTYAAIKALVSNGLPVYGMQGVGSKKDSPGSELIISELCKPDKRPLWICVWGGTSVLAQTLWKIKETVPTVQAAEYVSKLRVYTISDQLIRLPVTAPTVTSPTTVHFILKVSDKGSPPLTRYVRVIVHVGR